MAKGLVKASEAYEEFREGLPWGNRTSFYLAIERGEIPAVRFGSAVYVPRRALEAIAAGDLVALAQVRQSHAL